MICLRALKVTLVSTQQGNLLVLDYRTGLSSSPEIAGRISLPFAIFLKPHLPDGVPKLMKKNINGISWKAFFVTLLKVPVV